MTSPDPRSQQLSDMVDCAYRLGVAFGAAAEAALGTDRCLPYFNAFDRCFFSIRVSTALELRLRRASAQPREAVSDREALIERPDPPETPDPETGDRDRGYDERDRDRETERASLPILLRALEGVVADAAALPDPKPAELLTLRELLAHAKAEPGASSSARSLRARLTGSGAATGPPSTAHLASNVRQVLTARRATGPPRR